MNKGKTARVLLIVDGEVVARGDISQSNTQSLVETVNKLSEGEKQEEDPDWLNREKNWEEAWSKYRMEEVLSLP